MGLLFIIEIASICKVVQFPTKVAGQLEAEEVGKLRNQSTVDNTSLRCSAFVINQKKVTEWFVNQVKANITGHKAISATVLDQSIYEHVGIKRVGDTRTHQISTEFTGRKAQISPIPEKI